MRRAYGLAVLLVLLAGCIYIPEHRRESSPRGPIGEKSLQFIKVGSTTREEVLLNLGDPETAEESVFTYWWRTQAELHIPMYPDYISTHYRYLYELVIEFDDNGIVKHYETKKTRW